MTPDLPGRGQHTIFDGEWVGGNGESTNFFDHRQIPIDAVDRRPDFGAEAGVVNKRSQVDILQTGFPGPVLEKFLIGHDQGYHMRPPVAVDHGLGDFRLQREKPFDTLRPNGRSLIEQQLYFSIDIAYLIYYQ